MAAKNRVFPDEPIQWHRSDSTRDRCPDCGSERMYYGSKRERLCSACRKSFKLSMPSTQWLREKETRAATRNPSCRTCGGVGMVCPVGMVSVVTCACDERHLSEKHPVGSLVWCPECVGDNAAAEAAGLGRR